jgi:hypothetical protein
MRHRTVVVASTGTTAELELLRARAAQEARLNARRLARAAVGGGERLSCSAARSAVTRSSRVCDA